MAATYKRLIKEQQELANVESGASAGTPLETRKNKQRVLVLASRGITQRYRHLMEDFLTLLPHSVKESKFDQVIFSSSTSHSC
jgi:ribosome biogenesis protein BRX1